MTFHYSFRIIFFSIIALMWYFNVLLVAVPLTVWYVYQYQSYELIILGAVIDVYFMTFGTLPYYTLGAVGLVWGMQILKPFLRTKHLL